MATISFTPTPNVKLNNTTQKHGPVIEEIESLILVYNDNYIERPPIIPNIASTVHPHLNVTSKDVIIDKFTNLWARIYVPKNTIKTLPTMIYFHGGGFCVGSASWSCYHEFLANFCSRGGCVVISVNYRLAPENRLPAAYEDGFNSVVWIKEQMVNCSGEQKWWLSHCDFSCMFLAGDSAGGNIAYHVATRWSNSSESAVLKPLYLKGIILIQPFFGGETRTSSEKLTPQPPNSALTLSASDTYWRLSLPIGANRNHPWCNPLANGGNKLRDLRVSSVMVCISEMDILKDRNLEFSAAMAAAGKKVETVVYKGVGHAFQVLHTSQVSQIRTQELISHLKAFLHQN